MNRPKFFLHSLVIAALTFINMVMFYLTVNTQDGWTMTISFFTSLLLTILTSGYVLRIVYLRLADIAPDTDSLLLNVMFWCLQIPTFGITLILIFVLPSNMFGNRQKDVRN